MASIPGYLLTGERATARLSPSHGLVLELAPGGTASLRVDFQTEGPWTIRVKAAVPEAVVANLSRTADRRRFG